MVHPQLAHEGDMWGVFCEFIMGCFIHWLHYIGSTFLVDDSNRNLGKKLCLLGTQKNTGHGLPHLYNRKSADPEMTTFRSRICIGCIAIFHKYCCYTKHGGITTNWTLRNHWGYVTDVSKYHNAGLWVNGAWVKKYCVLCSKTYNTLHSCHNFPAGL